MCALSGSRGLGAHPFSTRIDAAFVRQQAAALTGPLAARAQNMRLYSTPPPSRHVP